MTIAGKGQRLILCNCQRSMHIDAGALARALAGEGKAPEGQVPHVHTELCRAELGAFRQALQSGAALQVACTQEAPLFAEIAAAANAPAPIFTNIREQAGWSAAGAGATPKMAALLAVGAQAPQPTGLITLSSQGRCLLYGRGQTALDVAAELSGRLSVTVVLADPEEALPPAVAAVPVFRGRIRGARGHLGGFAVEIDGYAPLAPSSRSALQFAPARDGAAVACDIILDLSGGAPLFTDVRREGYLRADPDHPAAVARAMFHASDLVGEFEKPLYVAYDAAICAHARSARVGCTRCLTHCPTGAITPDGDGVAIDPAVCGGCGSCSAVCPTGAVAYAYPQRADLVARLGLLIATYRAAAGERPVLVLHDDSHGLKLIDAMARSGGGLPANALPLSLFSVLQLGHETLAQALALGTEHVVVLAPPGRHGELAALEGELAILEALLHGLGYAGKRLHLVSEADPQALEELLHALPPLAMPAADRPTAAGTKRDMARAALARLRQTAPAPHDLIALPDGAPYGSLAIDVAGCTLCLACVGACPTGALTDNPDCPQLSFTESACVQCGICVATCPEKVISRVPRYSFLPAAMSPAIVKREEPFRCVGCGKPFGTRSSIERVKARLKGVHAMFRTEAQLRLIEMCDTCRITAVSEAGGDPLRGAPRPLPRTAEDYLGNSGEGGDPEDV
jgi:ferredoxin